ncbi:cytosine/adenosine deaminase-related metal-dependent hydrolase [Thermocatellispora tengchongensis]|uniref:Cytosine/adenosine deaminase-related metal-dependent hydrolase n=1 Tax=Thermocatellispora tengchongensis TaxID=1073253 RepID=A0A840NZP1_9ACTN|nr:amidohydrolase family protein [Thermocatellispora tengchongensis]MBB5132219.1 cytosine/adenosine deaminase-related metal-dependent hydrolase [Thermocatellispora tengchongensis]
MSSHLVITGGRLAGMDPAVPDGPGDVVVRDGVIVAAGPDAQAPEGATVLDASGALVLPGLVDTHRHTWQSAVRHVGLRWTLMDYIGAALVRLAPAFRPEDVYAGTLLGALGALDSGITTLVDWSHIQNTPEHTDAAIEALRHSGIRGVFAYGWPMDDPLRWIGDSDAELPADIRRVREELADDTARVTMALAARGPEMSTLAATRRDLLLARELGLRTTMHAGVMPGTRTIDALRREGLLDETVTLVHACAAGDDELAMAADAGATASVSPLIETTMPEFGGPRTASLLAAGITTGLSVDTEISTSGDLFAQMRVALAHAQGSPLTAADLLRMATSGGAAVAGVSGRAGTLAPGMRADLIVVAADGVGMAPALDPATSLLLGAHPGLVRHVVVDGRVVKRDGTLTGRVGAVLEAARESLEHLRKAVPDVLGS